MNTGLTEPLEINTPETLGVTPRYVLQHNAISRSIHSLSATAKKLTYMAMSLLPPDLSVLTAAFSFSDFCKAIGYTKSGESFKLFKAAVDECFDNKIRIEMISPKTGKKIWQRYTWFTFSEISEATGMCTMMFSPQFAAVLLEIKRVYARINLQDIGKLQSKYAIRLFEMAKSYESLAGKDGNKEGSWYFERTIQEWRQMFEIEDESYAETKILRRKVIDNPVKNINEVGIGVEMKSEGIKQGRRLTAIRVNCKQVARKAPVKKGRKKKADIVGLDMPDAPAGQASRQEKEFEHLKELYPAEFAELYEEELTKASLASVSEYSDQILAEWNALSRLRERYGIVK